MEVQIQELIDRIKSDGVKKAEETSGTIISQGESRAAQIIADAKKEAEKIVAEARQEATKFEASGKQAVAQAARDLILNVKTSISKMFDAILGNEVSGAMDTDFLKTILEKVLNTWLEKGAQNVELLLSEKDQKALSDYLLNKLKDKMKAGVTVKVDSDVNKGFRVSEKDGSAFYDLTDEGVVDGLKVFLNEKLRAILDEAVK